MASSHATPIGREAVPVPRVNTVGKIDPGSGIPRGIGRMPVLGLEAAAAFATYVDTARIRAAIEGRTLVYTVRWSKP